MKQFWLIINKDTFIWTQGEKGVIYNTGKGIAERFLNTGTLEGIITELKVMENLYRILLTEEQLADKDIHAFVEKLLATHSAVLMGNEEGKEIPVSLVPILKIQNDVLRYKYAPKKYKDESILSNCMRLVIHLNGSQYGNNSYVHQTIIPFEKDKQLCLEELKKFILSEGTPFFLSEIIGVGCIWEHESAQEIFDWIEELSIPTYIYCTEQDYKKYESSISNGHKSRYYIIKHEYENQVTDFSPAKDANYNLLVTSEEEYEKAMDIIDNHPNIPCRIIPIYNGKNNQFFEENIYLTEEDVLDTHLTKREIFAHQSINTNHFGTLTITTDGNVYGNLNEKPLSTIKDSLYSVTFRELTEGNSWLRIRDQKPCCNCIYQWLCPSPSHYEDVIGKPNLCHIKP